MSRCRNGSRTDGSPDVTTIPKKYLRKIILNLAVTLDGYIEGPNGEYDWCLTDQDYGMTDFLERTDAIFFGRKSYEVLMGTEKDPYPEKRKYVFSKTMKGANGDVQIIRSDIKHEVLEIKAQSGKDIWLFGGASLTASLMNAQLVDELQLSIHPIILGRGKALFQGLNERMSLTLTDTKSYSSGLVQLIYRLA